MTLISPIVADETQRDALMQTVLHVGCGAAHRDKVPQTCFPLSHWRELRLDIDPGVAPDIIASITAMPMLQTASVDGIWSAHNLEHLASHEVPVALAEFFRVLRPGWFAAMTLPDLQQVAALVAEGMLEEPAYISGMGPIAALDMIYGYRPALAQGNSFMGHRTGFTARTLATRLESAGFIHVQVFRDGHFALWAKGEKPA